MSKLRTQLLSVFLVVCMVLTLLPVRATEGLDMDSMPSVQKAADSSAVNFKITSVEDLVFAGEHETLFDAGDTLYLAADLNLNGNTDFTGFEGLKASFDGQNHMIYNWTADSKGLFYNCTMSGIQNLKLYKVKLDASGLGSGQWPALVFGMQQGPLTTLQTTFTMKNVHVSNSELIRPSIADTGAAVLLSRYRIGATVKVEISGCSVVNTAITGTAPNNNVGAVMGGISYNNAGDSTYELKNIFINGFKHLNAANHCGILIGEIEKNVNITNVGIFNSQVAAFGKETTSDVEDICDAAVIGRTILAGSATLTNVLMAGNTLSSEQGECYLIAQRYDSTATITLNNVYSDDDFDGVVERGDQTLTAEMENSAFAIGEVAYLAQTADCYWTMADGLPAFGTAENQTRKITVSGDVHATLYANGGETVELAKALPGYVFTADKGTLDETAAKLTMPAEDVALTAYQEDSVAGQAVAALAYFALRDTKYYAEGLVAALATTETKLAESTVTAEDVTALTAYVGNYKEGLAAPDLPSVSDCDLYPGLSGYMIFNVDDLIAAADRKELTTEQTLYLGASLDLTDVEFEGLSGVRYAFDGRGYAIQNWTAESRGFFDWYRGNSVSNLKMENIHLTWTTSDGVGLVVGRRYTDPDAVEDFTLSNVHVSNSTVTNQGNVVEDGGAILLGVMSRPLNMQTAGYFSFGSGKQVTVKNCSVTDTVINGEKRPRVAAAIGHVWGGFTYEISHVTVKNFTSVSTDAGLLLGEVENSAVSLTQVGIFNSTGAETALAAMGDGASITADNLLIADSVPLTEGVLYQNTYVDIDIEWIGVTTLSKEAFKNGEAAWKANAGAKIWKVGSTADYPTLAEGTFPYRITFGEMGTYYTYADGKLQLTESQSAELEKQVWVYGEKPELLQSLTAAFTADTDLRALEKGDLDGNGNVNLADVVLLLKHLVGRNVVLYYSPDISGDGRVSVYDAILLLRMVINQ